MNKRLEEQLETWGSEKEQVPDFFSKGIDDVLKNLPSTNHQFVEIQPPKNKWVMKSLLATAVVSFGIIGSGFVSPAMAQVLKEVPIIGSIFGGSQDSSIQVIDEKGLASALNETVTDNGVSLTITEAYFGGGRLVLAYRIETDEVELKSFGKAEGVPLTFDALINNHPFTYSTEFEQTVENGVATGIIDMGIGLDYPLIDQPSLLFNVTEIAGIKGSWNFDLLLGNTATADVTQGFAPLVTTTWEDATFVVERVEFTPAQSQIIIDRTLPKADKDNYFLSVYDENGTFLGWNGGSGGTIIELGNGMINFKETILLPGLEQAPDGLIIEITNNHGGMYDPTNNVEINIPLYETELPHTIDYPDGSKIIITNFEQVEDKTVIHYDIQGKLSLQNTFFMLFNQNGESIIQLSEPERTSIESLSFKREFDKTEGPITLSTSTEKVNTIDWQLLEVDLKN